MAKAAWGGGALTKRRRRQWRRQLQCHGKFESATILVVETQGSLSPSLSSSAVEFLLKNFQR